MDDERAEPASDVRWDELVADLEGQALAHEAVEDRALAGELARGARSDLALADRLRSAADGDEVVLAVRGAGAVRGTLRGVGDGCVVVDDASREFLVALRAVLSVTGLGSGAVVPARSSVERRWGIGHVLRRHARDRAGVRVVLDTGDVLTGTLDVVGSDHLELAEHPAGEPRRRDAVTGRRLIPFTAIAMVARERAIG